MPISNNILAGASGAGAYEIERSLRFNSADSSFLSKTFASASTTYTFSCWVKLGTLTTYEYIFASGTSGLARDSTRFYVYDLGGGGAQFTTDKFVDTAAWYHLVFSVNNGSFTLYINGINKLTGTADNLSTGTNASFIGKQGTAGYYYNGLLAEVYLVDGQALDYNSFAETDKFGVLQPKKYSEGYGTNGFHLDFRDSSSSANLGNDAAGSNNWTVNNLSVAAGTGNDSLVDSPTNGTASSGGDAGGAIVGNYCTLNPLDRQSTNGTLSNGNLDLKWPTISWVLYRSTMHVSSGKWYWEVTLGNNQYSLFGIIPTDYNMSTSTNYWMAQVPNAYSFYPFSGHTYANTSSAQYTSADTSASGTTFGIALDLDAGTLTYYKNGVSLGVAFTDISGSFSPAASLYNASNNDSYNFGQRSFHTAAPAGFLSLNTANLPTPTIADGSKNFETKLWTGTSIARSITGFNFAPSFAWVKNRVATHENVLQDVVRGTSAMLASNTTQREVDFGNPPSWGYINAFNSDGFSLATGANGIDQVNVSGNTYVGHAWDAGANSDKTYIVTVSGGNFNINGAQQPTLTLAEGSTYKFDQSDSSNGTHPLRFSTTSDGTHGGGLEYTTGVMTSGTPGSSGAYTQIVINAGAPTLYAYCTNHSGMGFQVNTSDTAGYTIPVGSINSQITNTAQTWSSNITTTGNSGNWWPSYPATHIFDATTTNYGHANGNGSVAAVVTLSFSPAITCLSSVSFFGGITSSSVGATIAINGGTLANCTVGSTATTETTVAFSGSISTITITKTATGGEGLLVYGFEIDGVRLTDNTGYSIPASPSHSTQVMASPESGFSIIKYTGNSTAGATFAHGLNTPPEFAMFKNRDDTLPWYVYHKDIGNTKYLRLNADIAAVTRPAFLNNTSPTSLVFTLGSDAEVNANTQGIICYAWSSIPGYSKVGKYTGNQNAEGPFVQTGFKPAWLMVKRSDVGGSGYDWFIWDDQRDPSNVVSQDLRANTNGVETTTTRCDFLSNGFKIRSATLDINASGGTFVYLCFASHPFKTARAY